MNSTLGSVVPLAMFLFLSHPPHSSLPSWPGTSCRGLDLGGCPASPELAINLPNEGLSVFPLFLLFCVGACNLLIQYQLTPMINALRRNAETSIEASNKSLLLK